MSEKFLKKLKEINKSYYTLADLSKIYPSRKDSLKVLLSRLTKKKKILRLKRDVYILPEKFSEIEKIANQIYFPSYLSFESALSFFGILSQIPYSLIFATYLKSKKITLLDTLIEYRQIKKELFFGYFLKNGLYIASPEKALLDTLYFVSLGKLKINLKNIDFSKIEKKKFFEYLNKYPLKTKKLVKEIFKNFDF
ncbi:hypothetical protein J7J37_00235 [bacterium]|nr:hypothetical protein [bacterium]